MGFRISGKIKQSGKLKAPKPAVPSWQELDATFYIEGGGVNGGAMESNAVHSGMTKQPASAGLIDYSDTYTRSYGTSIRTNCFSDLNMTSGRALDPTANQSWTMEGWFYTLTKAANQYIGMYSSASAGNRLLVYLRGINPESPQTVTVETTSGGIHLLQNMAFDINTWIHVSVNYDKPAGTIKVFLNGVLHYEQTSVVVSAWDDQNAEFMFISPQGNQYTYIDRFQIVPRALRTTNFTPEY